MKNNHVLFCLLLLITAANTAFAQRTLSPGTGKRMEQLPASVQNLIKRSGFDVPAKDGATDRNVLVLDSTKTFYGYFGSDSTPLSRAVYTYPSPNVKVEVISQDFGGVWEDQSRSTFTSDDQQRLTGIDAEVWDFSTQSWTPDSRLEVYPHGDSPDQLDSFITYLWDTNTADWYRLLSGYNVFDNQGRLLETYTSLNLGSTLLFKETYTYDANGDNIRIDEVALVDSEEYPSGLTENTFVNHLLTEVIVSIHDGFDWVLQNRAAFTYTGFGKVETHFSYEWDSNVMDWKQTEARVYEYDAQQRVESKATTFLHDDTPDEYELITYAYVENEDLALETIYLRTEDDPEWMLDTKTYYYYQGTTSVDPIADKAKAMEVYPNPTTGRIYIGLDAESEVRVFNTSGKLLKTMVMQPGQQVDLSDLPTGLYMLTAQKELEVYNGKVVKE